ncbi:MAG: hypothetical protein RBR08_14465 [Desulforegulaceae bacterium]|nr:hypothetical protein [Desulforegulaceae bacterium]
MAKKNEIVLDLSILLDRLDRIEKQVFEINQRIAQASSVVTQKAKGIKKKNQTQLKKTDLVIDFYKKNKDRTVSFKELKEKLPLEDKILRNIVFRLKKLGKIRQVERGEYQYLEETQES